MSLEPIGRERAVARVAGRLRPGWCGNLANGLAERAVAIERGRATQSGDGSWHAEFEIRARPSLSLVSGEVASLLATDAGAGFRSPIVIVGYRLQRLDTRGGCLLLEIDGEDRIGFLAVLLRRLAYLSLFPVELVLETAGGRARDRLWLRGGLGCAPDPGAESALRASLEVLARPEASRGVPI